MRNPAIGIINDEPLPLFDGEFYLRVEKSSDAIALFPHLTPRVLATGLARR